MESIFLIFQQLFVTYVDVPLAVMIVISAYFFRKFLCNNIFPKIRMEHKVLLWATLVSIIYYFTLQKTGIFEKRPAVIYFITYFFATSFYELLFAPLVKWVNKIAASDDKQTV